MIQGYLIWVISTPRTVCVVSTDIVKCVLTTLPATILNHWFIFQSLMPFISSVKCPQSPYLRPGCCTSHHTVSYNTCFEVSLVFTDFSGVICNQPEGQVHGRPRAPQRHHLLSGIPQICFIPNYLVLSSQVIASRLFELHSFGRRRFWTPLSWHSQNSLMSF